MNKKNILLGAAVTGLLGLSQTGFAKDKVAEKANANAAKGICKHGAAKHKGDCGGKGKYIAEWCRSYW